MMDIGMHPDHRSMAPHQKNYETEHSYSDECPWCGELIEAIADEGMDCLFQRAIEQDVLTDHCSNCNAELKISYLFVPLADSNSARVEFEIEARKKVA